MWDVCATTTVCMYNAMRVDVEEVSAVTGQSKATRPHCARSRPTLSHASALHKCVAIR